MVTVKRWAELSADEFFEIARLRTEVFFVEQRIDEPDFDDVDRDPQTAHHWIADDDGCAAYLRVVRLEAQQLGATLSFGRVAVRQDRRGFGLARTLVRGVIEAHGGEPMVIHSQAYVVGLYAEFGFRVVGELYYEAGLRHRLMVRD